MHIQDENKFNKIKTYLQMREECDNRMVVMATTLLERCRELGRENILAFCNGFNVPTQNLQKKSLMCREHVTSQTCYLLYSMVRLSIL